MMDERIKAAGEALESAPAAVAPKDGGSSDCSTARLTCSVEEFARMIGIGVNKAVDLCRSRNRPPGIRNGPRYLVITAEVPGWLREMSDIGLAI